MIVKSSQPLFAALSYRHPPVGAGPGVVYQGLSIPLAGLGLGIAASTQSSPLPPSTVFGEGKFDRLEVKVSTKFHNIWRP